MMAPFVLVIFGATGDLARHKLFPGLFSLYQKQQLGDPSFAKASEGKGKFSIVGFARRPYTDAEYGHWLGDELETHHDPLWKEFAEHISYQQGLFDERLGYEQLIGRLNDFDKGIGESAMRIFYLAT